MSTSIAATLAGFPLPRESQHGRGDSALSSPSDRGSRSHAAAEHSGGWHSWAARAHDMALHRDILKGELAKQKLLHQGLQNSSEVVQELLGALQTRHEALQERLRCERAWAGSARGRLRAARGAGPDPAPREGQECLSGSGGLSGLGGGSEDLGGGSSADFGAETEEFQQVWARIAEIERALVSLVAEMERRRSSADLPPCLWADRPPPPRQAPAAGMASSSSSSGARQPAVGQVGLSAPPARLVPLPDFSSAIASGLRAPGGWSEVLHL